MQLLLRLKLLRALKPFQGLGCTRVGTIIGARCGGSDTGLGGVTRLTGGYLKSLCLYGFVTGFAFVLTGIFEKSGGGSDVLVTLASR